MKRKVTTRKVLGKDIDPKDIDLQVLGAHSRLVVPGGPTKHIKGVHQCLLCRHFTTAAAVNMYGHIQKHLSGELSCSQCNFHARNTTALKEHIAVAHCKEHLYTCHMCSKGFFQKRKLLRHEVADHREQSRKNGKLSKKCSFCEAAFLNASELKKHMRKKHASEGLLQCSTCKKDFLYKSWHDKHVENCCIKIDIQYSCDMCGAHFPDAYRLKLHQRRVHDKEKSHICSFCDFRAFSKTSVKLHERTHTGVHPFKCDRCKFTAAKRFQLTSHLRTHSEDRAFQCDKCPYAGRWRVQLRNHLAAHQSPTCIACPFCKIVFPHLRSLSHHRHVHRNIKGNVFDSAIREHVQLQFPVSDEERPPNNDGDICVSQEKLRIVSKN